MFKNIIVTTIRNIVRNKTFTIINLLGLSLCMSLSLFIIIIVREQYSFDNFHTDVENIYRINTRAFRASGSSEEYASAPLVLGQTLNTQYTFIENVVLLDRQLTGDALFENVTVPIRGLFATPSFLEVFNFPLQQGDLAKALQAPNSILLTHQAAEKIFGRKNPMGEVITLKGYGEFTVTGVFESINGKTHFDFEVLVSSSSLLLLERQSKIVPVLENWNNYYSGYVYVKLPKENLPKLKEALSTIAKNQYAGIKLEIRDKGYEFYPQALSKITPGPLLSNQLGRGVPTLLLLFMSVLASLVMLMACFNYAQLTIAKSLKRAKEIGIRKTVGAHRWQIFFQFVTESIIFCLLAFVLSYLLLQLLRPAFMQFSITQQFSLDLQEDWLLYLLFVGFSVIVGIIAGIIPATYLSAFNAVKVLKGISQINVLKGFTFQKALITAQFTFSLVFILVVLVVYSQVKFMISADHGFNTTNILNIRLDGANFNKMEHDISTLPGVTSIGGVSHPLGTWADGSSDYKKMKESEPFQVRDFVVNENYLTNIEAPFLAGKNFSIEDVGSNERSAIINEMALLLFGFTDARSAIGQSIVLRDSIELLIIGVMKNFHYRPLSTLIEPVVFRCHRSGLNYLSIKYETKDVKKLIASIESFWNNYNPDRKMESQLMKDEIDKSYKDAGLYDMLNFVGYIAFVTITLACLGMLGMVMYSTQTRIKEMGIRKIMGATERQLMYILSRSFLLLIGIAIVIGSPLGFFVSSIFLDNFAYKIDLTPGIFLIGVFLLTTLGLFVISTQTIRAVMANPIDALGNS